jgi:hypothetical protein
LLPENISKTKAARLDQERFKSYRRLIIISTPSIYAQRDLAERKFLASKKLSYNELLFKTNSSTGYLSNIEFNTWDNGKVTQFPRAVQIPSENLYDYLTFMMYSENLDYYQCSFEKIKQKTRIISQIYAKRAEYLSVDATQCSGALYLAAKASFLAMSTSDDPLSSSSVTALKDVNQNLLISSCPLVY